MARPIPPTWGGTPVYSEGLKTQGLGPCTRRCIDRIRYGDMATPVNPIHNYRQHYAVMHAGAQRRRAHNKTKPLGPRPIGTTVHLPPRVQTTAQAKADRLALAEAKRSAVAAEALTAPPSCTICGLHIPDAYDLTFECPATLPQRRPVLCAITAAATTDSLIAGLIRGAPENDVLMRPLLAALPCATSLLCGPHLPSSPELGFQFQTSLRVTAAKLLRLYIYIRPAFAAYICYFFTSVRSSRNL